VFGQVLKTSLNITSFVDLHICLIKK
jgi:hypothetical protein